MQVKEENYRKLTLHYPIQLIDIKFNIIMRLSIRLQNHGKKHHPYWWIVVAPSNKNIFGRFTQHIGFWCPRENVNIKRQIVLNIPRLYYWIGNGAIPTPKIQSFLNMYGIFPKPWHYVKSAKQLAEEASKEKPEEEWTKKEKILKQRKRKRQERQKLAKYQYHRYEAYALRQNKTQDAIYAKHKQNQFENEVIRDMLLKSDFEKYDRLAELSNNSFDSKPIIEKLKEVKQRLRKCKSELALLEKQHTTSQFVRKSKIITTINELSKRLAQLTRDQSKLELPQDPVNDQEYVTEEYLEKKLKYELVTKKFKQNFQDLEKINQLAQPLTVGDLAAKLMQVYKKEDIQMDSQQAYQQAMIIFRQMSANYSSLTKFQLLGFDNEYSNIFNAGERKKLMYENKEIGKLTYKNFLNECLSGDIAMPSLKPVHPRPDLNSYIPEQHYDPIDYTKLDILFMDSLEPQEEIQKYHRKRNPEQTIEERKKQDRRKRLQRIKLLTEI